MPSPTSPSSEEAATGKPVTDAVAAVIDELRASATDPNVRQVIDKIAARLTTQFHNVPGYNQTEFLARAARTDTARAAEAAAKKLAAAAAARPAAPAAPAVPAVPGARPAAKPFDAAAEHRRLVAGQQAAAAQK